MTMRSPDEPLEARLTRLEERLEALIAHIDDRPAPSDAVTRASEDPAPAVPREHDPSPQHRTPLPPQFWALNALIENVPDPGGVVFAGSVDLPAGPVRYQWARPTEHLVASDWSDRAERAAALGHPLRLSILRLLLDGERTVAQLVDELSLGSTGVAYHHLNLLQASGWVTSPQRGTWSIPPSRIIPLLTIVIALEES